MIIFDKFFVLREGSLNQVMIFRMCILRTTQLFIAVENLRFMTKVRLKVQFLTPQHNELIKHINLA